MHYLNKFYSIFQRVGKQWYQNRILQLFHMMPPNIVPSTTSKKKKKKKRFSALTLLCTTRRFRHVTSLNEFEDGLKIKTKIINKLKMKQFFLKKDAYLYRTTLLTMQSSLPVKSNLVFEIVEYKWKSSITTVVKPQNTRNETLISLPPTIIFPLRIFETSETNSCGYVECRNHNTGDV